LQPINISVIHGDHLPAARWLVLRITQARKKRRLAKGVMEHLLSILYGVSGFAAAALYVPQILKYRRDHDACKSISLLSWGGWIAVTAVTIVYALIVIKSYLVAMVAASSIVAQSTVLFYGINARLAKRFASIPRSGQGVAGTVAHSIQAAAEI
jgi:hypothetical protein